MSNNIDKITNYFAYISYTDRKRLDVRYVKVLRKKDRIKIEQIRIEITFIHSS